MLFLWPSDYQHYNCLQVQLDNLLVYRQMSISMMTLPCVLAHWLSLSVLE